MESKREHTSGPWAIDGSWIVTGGGEGIGIAKVMGNIGQPKEANMRLIVASPIMEGYIKTMSQKGDMEAKEIINMINGWE